MAEGRTIVFVHGKAGSTPDDEWRGPLNERLRSLGYPAVGGPDDTIVTPAYLEQLQGQEPGAAPPRTWRLTDDEDHERARMEFVLLHEELSRSLVSLSQEPRGVDLRPVPDGLLPEIATKFIREVRWYTHSETRRTAVWRTVLMQMPQHGHCVVVAHSLGSVVMADLLDRLPKDLTVDLLVTIGSPLPIAVFRRHSRQLRDHFPYGRVRAWVNVFDRRDDVTIGRGIAEHYPVVDVSVDTGTSHSAAAYCGHPVVATAVGYLLFGPRPLPDAETENLPAREIDPSWHLQLLSFAFTNQLSATCKTSNWRWKMRLDAARREAARRIAFEVSTHDSLESRRAPTETDFLVNAADLVRDTWSDEQLLPFAVSLYLSPPVPPFDIEVGDEHRVEALQAVLDRVRRRSGNLTDKAFAQAVAAAVREATEVFGDRRRLPWGKVLIGAGLLVIAGTGVGLIAAVPAGLAGAAAITATLAAFGPGGMVGGMVTLAALTGAGSALASGGAARELTRQRRDRAAQLTRAAQALAEAAPDSLRATVAGMLAVVAAQRSLGMTSSAAQVEQLLLDLLAIIQRELSLHQAICPDRAGTKDWNVKADTVQRALEWLKRTSVKGGRNLDLDLPTLERANVVKALKT